MKGKQIRKTNWFLYFWRNGIIIFWEKCITRKSQLESFKKAFLLSSGRPNTHFSPYYWDTALKAVQSPATEIRILSSDWFWRRVEAGEFGPMRSNHPVKVKYPGICAKPTDYRVARFWCLWHLKIILKHLKYYCTFKRFSM